MAIETIYMFISEIYFIHSLRSSTYKISEIPIVRRILKLIFQPNKLSFSLITRIDVSSMINYMYFIQLKVQKKWILFLCLNYTVVVVVAFNTNQMFWFNQTKFICVDQYISDENWTKKTEYFVSIIYSIVGYDIRFELNGDFCASNNVWNVFVQYWMC